MHKNDWIKRLNLNSIKQDSKIISIGYNIIIKIVHRYNFIFMYLFLDFLKGKYNLIKESNIVASKLN